MSRAALLTLALLAGAAQAQTQVYRCGADGRSYSQEPCAGGQAVDVTDLRSTQQAAQTRQAALRDAREADAMQRARLQSERLAARQGPALIGASKMHPDDARCARGKCTQSEAGKRRHDKGQTTVTLYRGVDTR